MNDASADCDPFEVLAESFLERYRSGERPSIEELAADYPELAEPIRRLLPAMLRVERDLSIEFEAGAPELGLLPAGQKQIGDYRILREIGRGGMGVVYEAEQVSLGRRVALKVLPGRVAGNREALERFRREAKAAARLHHTNIVPVFEVGTDGDMAYYAMQFIQGQGLDQVIDELARLRNRGQNPAGPSRSGSTAATPSSGSRGPEIGRGAELLLSGRIATEAAWDISQSAATDPATGGRLAPESTQPRDFTLADPATPRDSLAMLPGGSLVSPAYLSSRRAPFFRSVAHIGRQVAQGLTYAHASGIVHRDIKPSNLLLDHAGVVWIADFGLAKGEDEGLTQSGDLLGTLRYMAPERFRGEGDERADVYALGLTLYELLTLQPVFGSSDRLKLIEQIKTEEPRKPRSHDPRIPRDLETIVLKAIEKDPKARYQSAELMAEDLRRFLADQPIRARQVGASERYWRWARRNPAIALLVGLLSALLIAVTVGSLLAAGRFSRLAERDANSAIAERLARLEADKARGKAEKARADTQVEAYLAKLNEVKALRAARQPGWRDVARAELSRLAAMPTPRRDMVELRTEATACIGTPDIRLVAKIEFPTDRLRSIAFSPDSRTLVTANLERGLDFWDVFGLRRRDPVEGVKSGQGPAATRLESGTSSAVYLSRDQGLVVATEEHGVVFTDLNGIRTSRAPITHGSFKPTRMIIDEKRQRIAVSWSDDGGVTVHDAVSGARLQRFDGSPFALSPDGEWIARTELPNVVLQRIGSEESKFALVNENGVRALAFSPDGVLLAGACSDFGTTIWHVPGRKQFTTLRGHRSNVIDVEFSRDGEWIATTSGDFTSRIWDTRNGQCLATLPGPGDMSQITWSPDGGFLAVLTNWNRTVFLYRITGRNIVHQRLAGDGAVPLDVASNPRIEQFATVSNEAFTWDVATPRPMYRRIGPVPGVGHTLAYSHDGKLLATSSQLTVPGPATLVLRDVQSGEIRSELPCDEVPYAIAFDESGQRLASGGTAGQLIVWDLATRRPLRRVATGGIYSLAFLDRNRLLASDGSESLFIYNVLTGEVEKRLSDQGGISKFLLDRQRNRVVLAFVSGAIGSASLPGLTPGPRLENAHRGRVEYLALSPDGRLVATGGEDHRVVLRNPLTLEPWLDLPAWTSALRGMAFDCTSRRLAIVGLDSDLELWNLTALNDRLTEVGLAWDQLAPAKAPPNSPPKGPALTAPGVAVLRP